MYTKENYTKKIFIIISLFWSSFLVVCFICECLLPVLKKKTKIKIKIYHPNVFYKFIFICCLVFHIFLIINERELYTSNQICQVYAVCSACVYVFMRQRDYSEFEINRSLKDGESIGALWALQTYEAYYKIILENIMDRMKKFEEKYDVQFFTKKLLLVIPLSCDIEGTFTQKDSSIEEFGNLEIVENDAGGNINRMFKNPVFKIHSNQYVYIVAEFSQPVAALRRSQLKEDKFIYIRNCFVKKLKSLLQGSPCILVLYDDVNGSESLSDCILSTIKQERKDFTV